MVALNLSNEKSELLPILKKLGIFLNKKDFGLDIKPLLRLVMSRYFGDVSCLVDAITQHFKNATVGTQTKVNNYYRNSNDNHEIV
jgi:U5 small nuclear ribonucleoprotein component